MLFPYKQNYEKKLQLKDSIDIRPRITDTANSVTSLTNISTNPADSTVITTISAGLHYSPPNASYTFDYEYSPLQFETRKML